jgi:hypothetical protein
MLIHLLLHGMNIKLQANVLHYVSLVPFCQHLIFTDQHVSDICVIYVTTFTWLPFILFINIILHHLN